MKKFKKSLVLAILVAFGLSFCGVFSDGAMALISTSLEYQGTWKEFNGSTWNEKSGTIHTNITTDYANVSCNGKDHVVVRTYKVGDDAERSEELNLKCGEKITPTEYVNGHQQPGKSYYKNVRDIENQLKSNGVEIYDNWSDKWGTKEDSSTQTDDKKTDTNVDDNNTKKNSGTEVDDSGSKTNDTTEDNQDPSVPKTMEYGEVDNKASILVGCDKAEQGGGEGIKCIINLVVDIMTVGVGILSVIGITVVGIQYLTSAGSEEKARKAKHRLFEIVIGVALYAVAYALLKWLLPSF